jgi:hypothetical protein
MCAVDKKSMPCVSSYVMHWSNAETWMSLDCFVFCCSLKMSKKPELDIETENVLKQV